MSSTQTTEPTPAPAPRSRYSMGSASNLVRSLVVILVIMAALVFLVPRVNSLSGPPVDIPARAADVATQSGWTVSVADGLPEGWRAASARYVRTGGGAMTWLAGYQTPSGDYLSVEQTKDASDSWVETEVNRAVEKGTVQIAGRTWTKYERPTKIQNSLVHRPEAPGELATLVTGTGSFEDARVLIEHLKQVSP